MQKRAGRANASLQKMGQSGGGACFGDANPSGEVGMGDAGARTISWSGCWIRSGVIKMARSSRPPKRMPKRGRPRASVFWPRWVGKQVKRMWGGQEG